MFTSTHLKAIIKEARPVIERQLDDAEIIAGFRTKVTNDGGDWGQVKALLKAMILDERDDAGDSKRVNALLGKAEHATAYADMLGIGNLNEKNSFQPAEDPQAPQTHGGPNGGEGDAPVLSADTNSQADDASGQVGVIADATSLDRAEGEEDGPQFLMRDGAAVARLAHNQEVVGAIPAPATTFEPHDGRIGETPVKAAEPEAGEASPTVSPAAPSSVVAFTQKQRRPWCQPEPGKPCAGYGPTHCGRCIALHNAKGVEIPHQGSVA